MQPEFRYLLLCRFRFLPPWPRGPHGKAKRHKRTKPEFCLSRFAAFASFFVILGKSGLACECSGLKNVKPKFVIRFLSFSLPSCCSAYSRASIKLSAKKNPWRKASTMKSSRCWFSSLSRFAVLSWKRVCLRCPCDSMVLQAVLCFRFVCPLCTSYAPGNLLVVSVICRSNSHSVCASSHSCRAFLDRMLQCIQQQLA